MSICGVATFGLYFAILIISTKLVNLKKKNGPFLEDVMKEQKRFLAQMALRVYYASRRGFGLASDLRQCLAKALVLANARKTPVGGKSRI